MYPASPPARAVLLAAAYLGIALEQKQVDIAKGEQFQVDFLKVRTKMKSTRICSSGEKNYKTKIIGFLSSVWLPSLF